MKIQFRQIENFVKSPDKKARVILVYGPDNGLVRERSRLIGKTVVEDLNDPFNVSIITSDNLVEDPAKLGDEAGAISMMGGDRLIRIEDGSDKVTVTVKKYLESPNDQALVVIQAAELGPKSSLRKLCETAKNAAALPCYVEDERNVANFIRSRMQEESLRIENDAVIWLASNITGDRGKIKSEIEKLVTYKGDDTSPISIEDVQASCGSVGEQSFDKLVYAVGGRNTVQALEAYNTLTQEGVVFISILRSLLNHFRRLHITKSYMQSGMDIESAMKKLTPQVFFKQAPQFKNQINNWSIPALNTVISRLTDIEAQCKRTGMPAEILCSQAILAISKMRTS